MCSLKCYRKDVKYYFCSVVYQEQQNVKVRRRVNLSVHLKDGQLSLISTNKGLTFSSIFKNETKYSEFINHIGNPEHKRINSRFRIGNHNFKIETGRFTITKIPEDLGICDNYSLNSVEHEMNVFFPWLIWWFEKQYSFLLKSINEIRYSLTLFVYRVTPCTKMVILNKLVVVVGILGRLWNSFHCCSS